MSGHFIEILIIALVGLAIFGPKTLQSMARNAGKGVNQAKDMKDKIMSELPMEEIAKVSSKVPTSPRHAVQMLMTPEQREKAQTSNAVNAVSTVEEPRVQRIEKASK